MRRMSGSQRYRHLRYPTIILAVAVCLALFVGVASAQQIGGTVTDTTGGVLPGVTVEARSPALIEQVRTTVTDGSGQYLIVALEPGTYSVTYTLPGFSTLVREEIVLTTGFTASIDVQLRVGDLEETVTVSGASPIVDIQNVEQRQVMDRTVMDSVPTGKSFQAYALLVPGMQGTASFGTTLSQDSGGLTNQTYQTISIHGGNPQDQVTTVNGLDVSDALSDGFVLGIVPDGNFQEMAIEYSGNSAEKETGGVQINMIPREGANQFSGGFFGTFALQDLQADNIDQDLRDRGLDAGPKLEESWLVNPSFGGPIVRDRLWFFVGHTTQRADMFVTNTFESQDPTSFVYVPDLSRPAVDENLTVEQSLHLTWQATPKDKVKLYWSNDRTNKANGGQGSVLGSIFLSPEAALNIKTRVNTYQATWVRPQTNRLLFEAGFSHMPTLHGFNGPPEAAVTLPGILDVPDVIALRNMSSWLSTATSRNSPKINKSWRASMSYVTGSHNLKVGTTGLWWKESTIHGSENNFTSLLTLMGSPLFANFATRGGATNKMNPNIGIYAQEQWTIDRMTVNAGVRFEYVKQSYPDHVILPSAWQPEPFSFPGQTAVTWKDFQPRLGVAYDLFGDGRTALKVSANRYGARESTNWAGGLNPAQANRTQRRFWVDLNGDGLPQGDPLNPAPNGELFSPNPNPAFGLPVITTFYDEDWAFGGGNRFSNREFSGSVQQQLMANVSLDVGYFRRAFGNFAVEDNRAVGPSEFDQYTIIAPTDPRVPGAGGNPVTLVDINPAAFGRLPDEITTHAEAFGGESRTWNGVDVTVDARLASLLLQGGVSTGKTATDYCGLASQVPEILPSRAGRGDTVALEFCQADTNWLTQVKLLGSYTLPYDIQVAGTYQSVSGPERGAEVTFTSAQIEEALGRPLAGGGAVSVDVLEPGTEFGERFNQVDLRFTKIINLAGTVRLRAMFDLFNVFNANAVTNEEYGVGPNYLRPFSIMPGRFGKFSFQIDF